MRIFDPHAHMTSRTTDDYEAMAASGVKVLVEPAFWLGQPRTSAGSFVDYFNSLLGWERFRASQFGIRHHCTIGLNPKEANDDTLRREVLALLPRFLAKDGVVAVGGVEVVQRREQRRRVDVPGPEAERGDAGQHEDPHREPEQRRARERRARARDDGRHRVRRPSRRRQPASARTARAPTAGSAGSPRRSTA